MPCFFGGKHLSVPSLSVAEIGFSGRLAKPRHLERLVSLVVLVRPRVRRLGLRPRDLDVVRRQLGVHVLRVYRALFALARRHVVYVFHDVENGADDRHAAFWN